MLDRALHEQSPTLVARTDRAFRRAVALGCAFQERRPALVARADRALRGAVVLDGAFPERKPAPTHASPCGYRRDHGAPFWRQAPDFFNEKFPQTNQYLKNLISRYQSDRAGLDRGGEFMQGSLGQSTDRSGVTGNKVGSREPREDIRRLGSIGSPQEVNPTVLRESNYKTKILCA